VSSFKWKLLGVFSCEAVYNVDPAFESVDDLQN